LDCLRKKQLGLGVDQMNMQKEGKRYVNLTELALNRADERKGLMRTSRAAFFWFNHF